MEARDKTITGVIQGMEARDRTITITGVIQGMGSGSPRKNMCDQESTHGREGRSLCSVSCGGCPALGGALAGGDALGTWTRARAGGAQTHAHTRGREEGVVLEW